MNRPTSFDNTSLAYIATGGKVGARRGVGGHAPGVDTGPTSRSVSFPR
jgi:hypothetical protein